MKRKIALLLVMLMAVVAGYNDCEAATGSLHGEKKGRESFTVIDSTIFAPSVTIVDYCIAIDEYYDRDNTKAIYCNRSAYVYFILSGAGIFPDSWQVIPNRYVDKKLSTVKTFSGWYNYSALFPGCDARYTKSNWSGYTLRRGETQDLYSMCSLTLSYRDANISSTLCPVLADSAKIYLNKYGK